MLENHKCSAALSWYVGDAAWWGTREKSLGRYLGSERVRLQLWVQGRDRAQLESFGWFFNTVVPTLASPAAKRGLPSDIVSV